MAPLSTLAYMHSCTHKRTLIRMVHSKNTCQHEKSRWHFPRVPLPCIVQPTLPKAKLTMSRLLSGCKMVWAECAPDREWEGKPFIMAGNPQDLLVPFLHFTLPVSFGLETQPVYLVQRSLPRGESLVKRLWRTRSSFHSLKHC